MKNGMSEIPGLADRSTGWNRWSQGKILALLATGLFAVPTTVNSATVVLDFEGITVGPATQVLDFYDNGPGGFDYGVNFSEEGLAVVNGSSGVWDSTANPSESILVFADSPVTLSAPGGITAFSFIYSAQGTLGEELWYVQAFDASNSLLADIPLAANSDDPLDSPTVCLGDPFCVWSSSGLVSLSGTATRLVFGGPGGLIGFDEITLTTPVPLPAAAWLLLSGLAGLGFVGRRRTAK